MSAGSHLPEMPSVIGTSRAMGPVVVLPMKCRLNGREVSPGWATGKLIVNGTELVDGLIGGGAWVQSPPPAGAPGILGNGCEVPLITTPTGLATPSSVRSTG